jgi:glycosyltransferase involved in cell wall biosynthesis
MDPEISVMMPTYKQSKYLQGAINSVLLNDGADLFISAVRSDYKTIRLLQTYDPRIKLKWAYRPHVWEQKELLLSGVEYHARRYTLDEDGVHYLGHGPFRERLVCRFDSDDIMAPSWLAKAIPIAKEIQSRGKVPIIGPSYIMTDEHLKPTQTVILPEFSMVKMLESCIIPEYSVMPIGPMLEVGGFYPKDYPEGVPDRYRWYAMMLRILKKYDCEVRLLPDIGFYYRQHRGQAHTKFTSNRRSKRNVEMIQKVAKHYG